jgi:hypothetical protein
MNSHTIIFEISVLANLLIHRQGPYNILPQIWYENFSASTLSSFVHLLSFYPVPLLHKGNTSDVRMLTM